MQTIKQSILDRGLQSNAKIILPEIDDSRIMKATKKLISMGYNIVSINDYDNNYNYDNIHCKLMCPAYCPRGCTRPQLRCTHTEVTTQKRKQFLIRSTQHPIR